MVNLDFVCVFFVDVNRAIGERNYEYILKSVSREQGKLVYLEGWSHEGYLPLSDLSPCPKPMLFHNLQTFCVTDGQVCPYYYA